MKIFFVLLVGLFTLSGCVFQRSHIATQAQTQMVGMSKQDLFFCAGTPYKQEMVGDMEFLSYKGSGNSIGIGTVSTHDHDRYCEVTFVLKNGVVKQITYQGRTGGLITRDEQCAYVVEKCIKEGLNK
jgi:hypothetical protein